MYLYDKSIFEGSWTDDMKNGEGNYNFDDGSNLKAIFKNDVMITIKF